MKTSLSQSVRWIGGFKSYVCLIFSGEIMVYSIVRQLTVGEAALPYSLIWQFLAIAFFSTLLQSLCFSSVCFKKMRMPLRMVLFTLVMLCMLSLFAWGFRWFPMDDWRAWLIFGGVFLAAETIIALSFEAYYRLTGEKYTAQLELYKAAKQKKER